MGAREEGQQLANIEAQDEHDREQLQQQIDSQLQNSVERDAARDLLEDARAATDGSLLAIARYVNSLRPVTDVPRAILRAIVPALDDRDYATWVHVGGMRASRGTTPPRSALNPEALHILDEPIKTTNTTRRRVMHVTQPVDVGHGWTALAVCNDGSVWSFDPADALHPEWKRYIDVPQTP